ncbi:serine threonine protein kinase : Serine/threonine protein kinase OS=Pirellula staleyi (strain ATCC 27377 / DSM 6068 / ICPB 4128) GN=Psta_4559 PE=3 SV=1: Pkinase: DJ-1_PfpI [Gemmata massiliana]|uniref:non-specific serine/threonine protein kinase n=1 Tax=Gemmata massiliana TaxID=1210884 RepID=A0A6P2CSG4_9BACT|nr:protein kinase [Gemmata massiliana]VTR91879.1 serine threonine protein kinase : Serine/threonine protein kinase OS=Pirellula staleyi (strain ATCC 27377 / DSM 6068 / ICPB 4128) GN=Psta_4559 PE=3 SV=1: Pkinase: DJ-1_PfpI [Gemmata massiliana]
MPVATCPRAETLAAFARGDLSSTELAGVADHVAGCTACGEALKFVPEDSLADLARAAVAVPPTVKSVVGIVSAGPTVKSDKIPPALANHPRYRIISELGAGGMGVVYKAEHRLMGRVVALKVVAPHLTAKASAVERFVKEFKAAGKLTHPNIVTYHDADEAGGLHFLAMEFIEGTSLDRLVAKKGPLPVPMACVFARQAALGLQHAAEKGMVHRDIKPQNLMVTRKGQVKVLDFGLARFAQADEADAPVEMDPARTTQLPLGGGRTLGGADVGVTNPNVLMGTPDYLSPEQARNSHDVDARSDIYSLGCTLYFLLTGKAPFLGATTLIDKLLAHTSEAPPPVRTVRPEIQPALADVLERMMAKKLEDRYQTAAEVASALLPFTRSDSAKEPVFEIVDAVAVAPVHTPAPVALLAFDTPPITSGPTLTDTQRHKRPKKSKKSARRQQQKRAVIGGAAAALFLFAAIAVAVVVTGKKKASDAPTDPPAVAKTDLPQTKGDKGEKNEKGEKSKPSPTAPTAITPPTKKGAQILFVLPSSGVWLDDFLPVRNRFVERGATVVTAAFEGDRARPSPGTPGDDVPIDVRLEANMNLTDYSALVFCGERTEEYMGLGRASGTVGPVIQKMRVAGKPVAAICVGQGVLATHGVLKGKKVAPCDHLFKKHPFLPWDKMNVTWDKPGVTVDGKVVTASGPPDAVPFADAILKLIEAK